MALIGLHRHIEKQLTNIHVTRLKPFFPSEDTLASDLPDLRSSIAKDHAVRFFKRSQRGNRKPLVSDDPTLSPMTSATNFYTKLYNLPNSNRYRSFHYARLPHPLDTLSHQGKRTRNQIPPKNIEKQHRFQAKTQFAALLVDELSKHNLLTISARTTRTAPSLPVQFSVHNGLLLLKLRPVLPKAMLFDVFELFHRPEIYVLLGLSFKRNTET
ncbi:hypothetical protein INT44_007837 [Umbelopsis vinacea]|uniref:Uncharacterized protein n=1 Tax=Umbelopsis vinacea TaxID=44442 RepID=A0A8H7PJN3_9FUNG|nr:hypothetical protein INT44_007837 [Umbelopsis vinacea]